MKKNATHKWTRMQLKPKRVNTTMALSQADTNTYINRELHTS